jgi:hypothetical protein
VDGDGKKIWEKPDTNVWHVETLDIHGDGHQQILHTNARGKFIIRTSSGEVIENYLPGVYASEFALTRWGSEPHARHILVPSKVPSGGCCKSEFLELDASGKTVAQFDAPLSDLFREAHGSPVRLSEAVDYYAVLQGSRSLDRSVLFLYDQEGRIAYQEILGESCSGVTALSVNIGERLLIGCSNRILDYALSP